MNTYGERVILEPAPNAVEQYSIPTRSTTDILAAFAIVATTGGALSPEDVHTQTEATEGKRRLSDPQKHLAGIATVEALREMETRPDYIAALEHAESGAALRKQFELAA